MQDFARKQTASLLRKLAKELKRADGNPDAEAIHDVRVVIRRLKRCVRLFAPFYPDRYWKKVRDQLSELMQTAGSVRDCDIAIELLEEAGVSRKAQLATRLVVKRGKACQEFVTAIRRWDEEKIMQKWKSRLEV